MSTDDLSLSDVSPGDGAFRERLTAYLDDRMTPDEARAFLSLLQAHPGAWKEAEASRRVWSLLAAYRDEPIPEGFAERVLARVGVSSGAASSVEGGPRRFTLLPGGRRARALAAAAAILVAVGAGALIGRGTSRLPETPVSPETAVASLDAMPAGVLDRLDGDSLVQLASLSDEEFDALLTSDPQDLTARGG